MNGLPVLEPAIYLDMNRPFTNNRDIQMHIRFIPTRFAPISFISIVLPDMYNYTFIKLARDYAK